MKKEHRTFQIQMPVSHSVCTPLSEFFPYYGVFSIEKQKSTVAHCIVDYRNTCLWGTKKMDLRFDGWIRTHGRFF